MSAPRRSRSGQAYLETFLVLLVLLLVLFGFLQVALSFGDREVVHHAAARAARATLRPSALRRTMSRGEIFSPSAVIASMSPMAIFEIIASA